MDDQSPSNVYRFSLLNDSPAPPKFAHHLRQNSKTSNTQEEGVTPWSASSPNNRRKHKRSGFPKTKK